MAAYTQTALVVGTDDPLDNRMRLGGGYDGWVRILVNGPSPIYTAAKFKLDRDHWLVRGMQVPVAIDPEQPGAFEIAWDGVAPIEERVAANDPALADPIGAYKRVLAALVEAGVAGEGVPAPQQQGIGTMMRAALGNHLKGRKQNIARDQYVTSLHAHGALFAQGDTSAFAGNFDESMARIAAQPAAPGTLRAGVLFSAHAATLKSHGDADSNSRYPERHGKHEVVLSVNVPGAAPYAVHLRKFDHKGGKAGLGYMAAMPALVSATDRNEVEVQWDELLSIRQARKLGKKMAAERGEAMQGRVQVIRASQAGWQPDPAAADEDPMDAYRRSARASIAAAGQSAQRQMVIEQWRSMGVKISDTGEVED